MEFGVCSPISIPVKDLTICSKRQVLFDGCGQVLPDRDYRTGIPVRSCGVKILPRKLVTTNISPRKRKSSESITKFLKTTEVGGREGARERGLEWERKND